MFPLIPYNRIFITTQLNVDEAATSLAKQVHPRSPWFPFVCGRSGGFEGKVAKDTFKINRAINYRNSFLPILHGRFHATATGSKIEVKMIPHVSVIAFLVVWYVLTGGAFFQIVMDWRNGAQITGRDLIPMGMFMFAYLMCFFAFGFEVRKATEFIHKVFEDARPNKPLQPTTR